MSETPDILKKILARKVDEVAERRRRVAITELRQRAQAAGKTRGFLQRMQDRVAAGEAAVIAEIKKASPSKGVLRADFDPRTIAKSYEQGGATCLSVLTDADFFEGSEHDLMEARGACALPVLRKDFLIDPYQVYEARAIGADCILLIVAAAEDTVLRELALLAADLGMDVLVEVHDRAELERALDLGATMIGINNRDLRSFETRLETTLDLIDRIPAHHLIVTESGIHDPEDVSRMRQSGVDAFLVGEAFIRAEDPGSRLRELFSPAA